MDAIVSGLANLGGVGLLAVALLLLHRESLARFAEELRIERENNNDRWKEFVTLSTGNHAILVERLGRIEEILDTPPRSLPKKGGCS